MSCRRCRYQHGVVDGLCGNCSRWTNEFTADELAALAVAVAGFGSKTITRLRLEILAARVGDGGFGGTGFPALVAARVSETGG